MSAAGPFELGRADGPGPFAEIGPGGVAVALADDGGCRIGDPDSVQPPVAIVRADRRGLVLEVGRRSTVHVNGRPVRERALIRPGDLLVIGRCGFLVRTLAVPPAPPQGGAAARVGEPAALACPRAWLRCVVGRHAGQVRPLTAGVEVPWSGALRAHARFDFEDGRLVVRASRPDGLSVDGHRVAGAVLAGGEQIIARDEYFLVDGVALGPTPDSETAHPAPAQQSDPVGVAAEAASRADGGGGFSPWWLLAAAVAIAGALVLLFGRL